MKTKIFNISTEYDQSGMLMIHTLEYNRKDLTNFRTHEASHLKNGQPIERFDLNGITLYYRMKSI